MTNAEQRDDTHTASAASFNAKHVSRATGTNDPRHCGSPFFVNEWKRASSAATAWEAFISQHMYGRYRTVAGIGRRITSSAAPSLDSPTIESAVLAF